MHNKIFIITFFISNIAFAAAIPIQNSQQNINENKLNTLLNKASLHLSAKGLDENVAKEKVVKSLSGSIYNNNLMAKNITDKLDGIKEKDIISYICESALYGKNVDLSLYDNIISITQKNSDFFLNKATIAKIQQVSSENKQIKLLNRV